MTDRMIEGYRAFREKEWVRERARWEELASGQSPRTMIVACSDSRVDPTIIFQAVPGEMFVVRNVAALVPPFEVGGGRHGVSAALEFAVTQLEVAEIMVMGHGACGGCAAALSRTFEHARAGEGGFIAHWIDLLDEARAFTLDGQALPAFVGFINALAGSSTEGVVESAERFAHLGYCALAAEASSAARDFLARDGRTRDAAGWARRAGDYLAATEGGVPPLFALIETVVPLTRREREIAAFVAAGRTSREVAESCFLSVRTVETHLARVYDKLGVRTRAELAEALLSITTSRAA